MTRIEQIIEDLKGTCDSLDGVCGNYDIDSMDLSIDELEQLDQEIFNCETCGWWCETSEMSEDENVCEDCFEDQ